MAKRDRNRNLAGLAALGALGYHLANSKQTVNAPVEYRGDEARRLSAAAAVPAVVAPAAVTRADDEAKAENIDAFLARELARGSRATEGVRPASMEGRRPAAPARVSAAAAEGVGSPYIESPEETMARVGPYMQGRRAPAAVPSAAAAQDEGILGGTALAPGQRNLFARDNRPDLSTAEGRAAAANAQALERVYPETLYGGPGLKGLHAAAKALANRPPALREVTQQALPAPTARLTGPSKTDLMARDRAARAATQREEMLQENARRYGLDPNAPGYEATARALREGLGGGAFTLKKKGGMVKAKAKKMASGGSTSSASKRGDGIAQRGKTKCKMY